MLFRTLTFIAAAEVILSGCSSNSKQTEKPNILFIAVDDLRPELGCYGVQEIKTPNIDRLASAGMVFNNAYCQSAVCNPSRASLLTGLRPDAIRVWDLHTEMRTQVPDVITLPQYFGQQGYVTTAIGKIFHNIFPDTASWTEPKIHLKDFPFDPDAVYFSDESLDYLEKRKAEITANGNEKRHIDQFGQWYLKAHATESPDVPDNYYYDGAQTDVAVVKIGELSKGDKPFFFGVGYYRPHLPFNAPKKYWDMYNPDSIPMAPNRFIPDGAPSMAINNLRELLGYVDFRGKPRPWEEQIPDEDARRLKHGYYASVSYVDTQIGRLLDALQDNGIADNTIVILWGDHGWKLGEHNSWCKMTNYEIDTRVPLILSYPGQPHKGEQSNRLVEFVDVFPTLCDLAGLPIPENLDGLSMKALAQDPERDWKSAVYSQFLREGIWRGDDGQTYMGYAVRSERYRYVEWYNWESKELAGVELYDEINDPMENKNLALDPQMADEISRLKELLEPYEMAVGVMGN